MFHANMRKMEQAGGDRVCMLICWSSLGAAAWKHCSLLQICDGLFIPLEPTFGDWTLDPIYPAATHCYSLILCSAEMHSLLSAGHYFSLH